MSSDSSEKTEKGTAKKREDARKKGNVRKSTEVNTAFCTIVMVSLLISIWPWYTEKLMGVFVQYLSEDAIVRYSSELSASVFTGVLMNVLMSLLGILFPLLIAAMIAGVAINLLQTGFLYTTETLKFKLSKINPISGFKRFISLNSLVELAKSIIKITILGFIVYGDYKKLYVEFPMLMGENLYTAFLSIMDRALRIALKMAGVMVVIAAADFFYQWWKYEKDLRMTKQEVKDEYKQMEGDPKIKSKIKAKQRQMSAMRMMSSVPDADVVITNPTHYAIALKYDDKKSTAPVVVAKGQDYVARKIKEIAIEHNIEIVENKPLAQALYAACEIDDEIPAEFYQAVADILVFVYKQKQSRGR